VKRRYHDSLGGEPWSLDCFEGAVQGHETIECEARSEASLAALVPPDWALREIAHLPQWPCGALALAGAVVEA
jgi:CYTH domain-containing protein